MVNWKKAKNVFVLNINGMKKANGSQAPNGQLTISMIPITVCLAD